MHCSSQFICANVGPQGLPVVRLPAPFLPHSTSLGPTTASRVLSTRLPVSAPPTGLDECLFFMSLVSDFLAIRFSVSSGCARRRSVSTYAAILVLSRVTILITIVLQFYFSFKTLLAVLSPLHFYTHCRVGSQFLHTCGCLCLCTQCACLNFDFDRTNL